ncbi:hypothetical protein KAR91_10255, partial [Candidatus Pacearchaeota archaeon]|nr:hypothetical protein [Candidatus Pacearchaeota archaeon]
MIKTVIRKSQYFYKWFKKPKTTVYLIACLIAVYMSGLLIPQKVFFQTRDDYEAWLETFPVVFHFLDVVGFTDIYLSPVTLFFLTLFFINLIIVTMERIPLLIRQSHIGEGGMPDFKGRDLGLSAAARDVTINSSDRAGVIKIAE